MNRVDVLLIIPPIINCINKNNIKFEYLGAGYLIASLPKEISAGYIDAYNYDYSFEEVLKFVKRYNPSFIGISCNFFNSVPSTVILVNKLRNNGYKKHISIGGHGAVSCKDKMIEKLDIDSICLCEGEICFPELITKYLKNEDYTYIKGYWFKKRGEIIKNEYSMLVKNLDEINFPIRTNIITNKTLKQDFENSVYSIITSRGCPYKCKFCDIKSFYNNAEGKSWRMRSVKNIVDEIENLYNRYGVQDIFFGDDNFIGSTKTGKDRMFEFCDELDKRNLNITFSAECRVTDVDVKLFRRLKESGLKSVMLGIENGSQSMLDRWNKSLKVEESINAIKILRQLNINVHANYILYDMNTTINELEENYDFMLKTGIHKTEDPIYLFNNHLGIFPGTEFEAELKKSNRLRNYIQDYFMEDEQRYIIEYGSVYSYEIEDNQMKVFIKNNDYWIKRIEAIFQNELDEKLKTIVINKCGHLYLELFKTAISYGKIQSIGFNELDSKINMFLKKVKVNE